MSTTFATAQAPTEASFAARFTTPLPRGLRAAGQMTWEQFLGEYAQCSGPLRLGRWSCTDERGVLGPQARTYRATLACGDTITTTTAEASGPMGALTAMLHDRGISVEITSFHQLPVAGQIATFIEGGDGMRRRWAMGLSENPEQSALSAVIACANRLMVSAG